VRTIEQAGGSRAKLDDPIDVALDSKGRLFVASVTTGVHVLSRVGA